MPPITTPSLPRSASPGRLPRRRRPPPCARPQRGPPRRRRSSWWWASCRSRPCACRDLTRCWTRSRTCRTGTSRDRRSASRYCMETHVEFATLYFALRMCCQLTSFFSGLSLGLFVPALAGSVRRMKKWLEVFVIQNIPARRIRTGLKNRVPLSGHFTSIGPRRSTQTQSWKFDRCKKKWSYLLSVSHTLFWLLSRPGKISEFTGIFFFCDLEI